MSLIPVDRSSILPGPGPSEPSLPATPLSPQERQARRCQSTDVTAPFREDGCRERRSDKLSIPGRHCNTLDLCALGWFTLAYDRTDAKPGYVGGISARPIRAEEQLPRVTDDRCRLHGASIVVNPSSRWRMGYCSHPLSDSGGPADVGASRRYHEGQASIVENEDAGIKPGYVGFLGTYHTPRWYEFVIRSNPRRCQGFVS